MSEGPKMNVDPKDLVQGAEVTLRATVMSPISSGVTLSTGAGAIWVAMENYPAILSVTPPPVDWSKVRRAVFQGEAGDIVAVDGNAAWIRFDRGGNKILALSSLSPLVSLPDADDAQAGEAKRVEPVLQDPVCRQATAAYRDTSETLSTQEPNVSQLALITTDTRPAWQRAKVGDVVSVRVKVERIGYPEDHPEFRLNFGGCKIIAAGSDILEIVRQADEKC